MLFGTRILKYWVLGPLYDLRRKELLGKPRVPSRDLEAAKVQLKPSISNSLVGVRMVRILNGLTLRDLEPQ